MDIEAYARQRERELHAKHDGNEGQELDPRDEKGLIKVEDHKNLGRDPKTNAIVNTDSAGFNAYVKARDRANLGKVELDGLKNEINELKDMLKVLVEKGNK